MSGEQVEADSDAGTTTDPTGPAADWSIVNWIVIVLFSGLTLVGIAFAIGLLPAVVAVPGGRASPVSVPLYVYLYAGFGALGYAFTKLVAELDEYTGWGELEQLVEMGLRVPAAWILATGVYLLFARFVGTGAAGNARLAAGVVFLVGLYVNVALKGLGSLADRILGRGVPPSGE